MNGNIRAISILKKKAFIKQKKQNKRNVSKYNFFIKAIIILCLFILFKSLGKEVKNEIKIEIFNIDQFFNTTIRNNSILIFEKNYFHYECTPGYTKYFLDLGFNVDIIMTEIGNESFVFFEPTKKLRFFKMNSDTKYYESDEYIEKLNEIFQKYIAILFQTMTNDIKKFYRKSNLFTRKNSILVYHYYPEMIFFDFHNKIRSWTLLNVTNDALGVNPHYFGKIRSRDKNKITKFFIASTLGRNYDQLISASENLKNESLQFQVVVTGRCRTLSEEKIPNNIKDIFLFNLYSSYYELMKIIETIDFIIITLDLKNPGDNTYIKGRSTGSAQLSYGFLKPCLINSDFSQTYKMNNENSIIFNNVNDSLSSAMREAIMMTNEEYKKKQNNLKKTADEIYEISKNNVKTTINYILNS